MRRQRRSGYPVTAELQWQQNGADRLRHIVANGTIRMDSGQIEIQEIIPNDPETGENLGTFNDPKTGAAVPPEERPMTRTGDERIGNGSEVPMSEHRLGKLRRLIPPPYGRG